MESGVQCLPSGFNLYQRHEQEGESQVLLSSLSMRQNSWCSTSVLAYDLGVLFLYIFFTNTNYMELGLNTVCVISHPGLLDVHWLITGILNLNLQCKTQFNWHPVSLHA